MASYTGEGNTETINLGWDSVNNINGIVQKNSYGNYFLRLSWSAATPQIGATVKYCIKYEGQSILTTETNYLLTISYGLTRVDEKTGIVIALEQCVEIETRYYFTEYTYGIGETKEFCFCPPVDPFCKKSKKTKTKEKNISSKMKYSQAIKNKNGALGGIFEGCSPISHWNQLSLGLQLSKNDCYKRNNVLILPNQSENQQNTITYGSRLRRR